MATVWLDTLVLMLSPACCHSGAKRGGWICIILSECIRMTYLGIFYDISTRPWLFCEVGIPVILVGFNSFCQLPLSIWLISTIKWDTLKCRIDAWVRILKLSFLYQSFETVLVARYQKVFLGNLPLFDHCCQYCIASLGRNESFDLIKSLSSGMRMKCFLLWSCVRYLW